AADALERAQAAEHEQRRRLERLRSLRAQAEREQAVLRSRREELERRQARLQEQLERLAAEYRPEDPDRLSDELATKIAKRSELEQALDQGRIALAEVHRRQAMAAAEAMARTRG